MTVDLHLDLDLDSGGHPGLRGNVEESLREAIRSGRLSRGSRLPATRSLARDLGVARGTVVDAYAQLSAEGWVSSVQGSGTFVAAGSATTTAPVTSRGTDTTFTYDMSSVTPDLSSFPRAEWLRALRRGIDAAPHKLFGYTDARGIEALRIEIAGYLGRARGLQVTPENLIVTTGYTQSLNLMTRVLRPGRVAMEEPSHVGHRAIVSAAGHEVVLLRVDEAGADLADLNDADLAVLTPNRQYPLGVTLSAERRARLLDWSRESGSFILENDYDGEFRYGARPLGALQSLDPSRVVYAGTVSKSLAPGLRIGWLAVPDPLIESLSALKNSFDSQNAALEQLAFAEFLREGGYDRHIRRQRLRYRQRRDKLIAALPRALTVSGGAAGLSLVLELPDSATERRVLAAAADAGLSIQGLESGAFYEREPRPGLLIGYAAEPERSFDDAVGALLVALARSGFPADPGRRTR